MHVAALRESEKIAQLDRSLLKAACVRDTGMQHVPFGYNVITRTFQLLAWRGNRAILNLN